MTATIADLHAKILAFMAGAFALEGHQTVVRVELSYAPPGAYRADPLKTWSPETSLELFGVADGMNGQRSHVFVERLVAEIVELAENHADSYGASGPTGHRFQIRTIQHMGGRQLHAFRILPSLESSDDQALAVQAGAPGELVPTNAGVIGMLMRHLEARDRNQQQTLQGFIGAINHHTQQMREENADLRAQIVARDKERAESWRLIEEAKSTEHARQIEAQIVVGKEERKTMTTKKIVNLLPVFMSKWLGSGKGKDGEVTPPKSPLGKAAAKLIGSLTGDQRDELGGILSMEQQIALAEVVEVVKNGDSPLLPTMLNDLVSSMKPTQVQAIMVALTTEQRTIFVEAIQLAQNQAEASADTAATLTGADTKTDEQKAG